MSGLLTLAGVATAMAALVLCVDSVIWESVNFFFMEVDVCDHAALATTPTWYTWNQQSSYQDSNWLEDRCRAYIAMLMVRTESRLPGTHHNPLFLRNWALEGREVDSLNSDYPRSLVQEVLT